MRISTATRLSNIPALTISFTSIKPLAKTMAFGGVAMGSIKAQLLAIVTGMSRYTIGIPRPVSSGVKLPAKEIPHGPAAAVRSGYAQGFSTLLQGGSKYAQYKLPSTTFDYNTKAPRQDI